MGVIVQRATRTRERAAVWSGLVAALSVAAALLLVTGTFLPWVSSGSVLRNSYSVAGLADRFGLVRGAPQVLISIWPVIGPVTIAAALLVAIGPRRTGATVAIVVGLTAAAVPVAILIAVGNRSVAGVALANSGPLVTLAGGLLLITAGITRLLRRSSIRWNQPDGSNV